MSKIKFSVVIPTCDRSLLLKETLKSVFSQRFPPDEILIIDNGIKQVDARIFEGDKRIRYIRALPRIGVAQARNMGICLARGDYVAFLDDDDIWDKNYLEEIARVIGATGVPIVLGGVKILETGEIWQIRSGPINSLDNFKKDLLLTNPGAMGSNTVVERKLLLASSGFDPFLTTGEDRGIIFDLLSKPGAKVVRAEKAFAYYRTAIKGEKLSNDATLAKGKIRFLVKYWKVMDFSTRVKVFLDYLKLKSKKAAGIMIIWRKIIKKVWGQPFLKKASGNFKEFKNKFFYYLTTPYRMATARSRALPDFLIIGTQKGGTRSLRYFLSQHPQIQMARDEVHYFDRESNYKKGALWYRSHFPLRNTISSGELVGEGTPAYLFFSNAAKRIQKDLQNAKLICLLRNPTERAISQYFMELGKGKERLPIAEAMLTDQRLYKSRGLYLEQLKRYESYLKDGRLLILSSEEFFSNPQKILKQVFRFLGVDETFECPNLTPKNVGKNKPPVPREVFEHLNEYFKLPNRRLYKYLNRDLGWRTVTPIQEVKEGGK